ncbi:MAG: HK97 family phage prohead protease [Elusimicrobiota bacterium]
MEQTEVVEKTVAFTFPLDVRKSVEQAGEFHVLGYAATTDFDNQGDILAPEALEAAALDLIKNSTVLLNHDLKLPIGRVVSVKFDNRGLLIDALISSTEPEVIQKIKEGVLNKFSIRGQVLDRERKFSKEQDRVVNIIKRVSLVEVSLVSVPANPEARAIGWYISKALDEEGSEGGDDMNDVTVEPISPEAAAGAEGAVPAPGAQPGAQPEPGKAQGSPQDAPKPSEQPQPGPGGQAAQPAAGTKPPEAGLQDEVSKALTSRMSAMLEPVLMLMEKLSGQVGEEAKPLAKQIKAMLLTLAGKPPAAQGPAEAAAVSKQDVAALVSAEVQKQLKKTLDEIPTLRKGLVSQEGGGRDETEEVMKAFGKLDPSDKLRTLLKLEHGRQG